MIVYDSRRNPIELGASVGRGGEAVVYRISGQPTRLAKLYEPAPRPNYARKLTWMVEHPPLNPTSAMDHPSLAWPENLLYDAQGQLLGYRMPFIRRTVPLLDVFNPRRRAAILPQFDRLYLHRVARNLATALSALHRSGYVAGDLNESNVLVTPSALVTIIDTDSFQVTEKRGDYQDVIHPCPVGKLEYTPAELQGKPLAQVIRLPEHDSFALGVLIFQLLMEGSHPFRAQWQASGDPPPIEVRIAQGAFPYTTSPNSQVHPPKNAPELDTLYPWLAELVRRCFIDGHRDPRLRPDPDLWASAIAEAETHLVACSAGHLYSGHLGDCPYCSRAIQRSTPAPAFRKRPVAGRVVASSAARSQTHQSPTYGSSRSNSPFPAAARSAAPNVPPVQAASSAPAQGSSSHRAPSSPGVLHFSTSSSGPSIRLNFPFPWGRIQPSPTPSTSSTVRPGSSANSPQSAPFSSFNFPGGIGIRGRSYKMSAVDWRVWLRQRLVRSFLYGGSFGALAGVLPGIAYGLMAGTSEQALAWGTLFAMGGASGGLLRGWQPGHRMGGFISRTVGWQRFWQGVGLILGGMIGGVVGLAFGWAIFPIIAGPFLGAKAGWALGQKIYRAGQQLGWEQIWAGLAALSTAGVGWLIAGLVGSLGLSLLGAHFANALVYAGAQPLLTAVLAGAFTSALGGLVSGTFADLVSRLLGLQD